jgi:hypothetical protein
VNFEDILGKPQVYYATCFVCQTDHKTTASPNYATTRNCVNCFAAGFESRLIWRTSKQIDIEKPPRQQYSGAVRLFRYWTITGNNELSAIFSNYRWQPGDNVAENTAPAPGFYGWNDLSHAEKESMWIKAIEGTLTYPYQSLDFIKGYDSWGYVLGTFLGHGVVKVHEKGARCAKALPEYIIESESMARNLVLLEIAEKYGMNIITLDQAKMLRTGIVPYTKEV